MKDRGTGFHPVTAWSDGEKDHGPNTRVTTELKYMTTKKKRSSFNRMKRVRVAGVQIASKPLDITYNIEKTVAWFRRAVKDTGAELVVFPENVTTGFNPNMPRDVFFEYLPSDMRKSVEPVRRACRALRSWCVLPTYERGPRRHVIHNCAYLIDPRGGIVAVYRKTHPFPNERISAGGWTTPGREYPVADTGFGKVGMMLCYDGDFPEVSRILAVKGAQIIVRPSALLRSFDIWETVNKARAYDNHAYLIAVNAVGSDASGTHYFGHSMIVSPIAQTLALARGVEDIIYAELDPDPIKRVSFGSDSPMVFDHLEDRNVKSYGAALTQPARSSFEPARRYPAHETARRKKGR